MFSVRKWDKGEKPTIEILEKELVDEGLSPTRFDFGAGDVYGEHTHPNDEVRVIVSGRMLFGIPALKKEVVLAEGDRLDIKAGVVHYAKVLSEEGVVSLTGSKSS